MSQNSPIEWTEATWNPVRGCVQVSPGCANCYAKTFAERWRGVPGHAYEQGFDLRLVPEKLDEPLRTKKPTTYFVNSMSDLFQDGVPDEFIDRVFAVMALAPRHTFQVLTKRADRMRSYLAAGQFRDVRVADAAKVLHTSVRPFALPSEAVFDARRVALNQPWQINAWPLPNVWLGVSVENQHFADERIPLLLQTPAAVRFISAEPLLSAVDLREYLPITALQRAVIHNHRTDHLCGGCGDEADCDVCGTEWRDGKGGLDWAIVGGESGHGARLFDVAWARSIVTQCKAAGVPVFVKQLGANAHQRIVYGPMTFEPDQEVHLERMKLSRKGGDPAEWPEDLRVREMPERPR